MKKTIALFLLMILAFGMQSHEYLLLPRDFQTARGSMLELRLFVTDGFNIEMERGFQQTGTKSLGLLTQNGNRDLLASATDGQLPFLRMEVDFDGFGLFHSTRDFASISLDREGFIEYLREDNIENIHVPTSLVDVRERYARTIKCLVLSGEDTSGELFKQRVGQDFEIILLDNPFRAELNDWLKFQVFFKGQPLADKVITARHREGSQQGQYQYARTNTEGIASIKLEHTGIWFLHSTHMVPSDKPEEAEYDSFWTSFSFAFPSAD